MNNDLILQSNNDIPFLEAQINIHQPTLSEISLISEECFFFGCKILNFSKYQLKEKDRTDLEDKTDFEILMSIICSKEWVEYRNNSMMVLSLLFPEYKIKFLPTDIVLYNDTHSTRINKENYDAFKDILVNMFLLNDSEGPSDYNPADARAEKIAEKFKNAKKKRNLQNNTKEINKVAVFSRYVSILSVGLKKDKNELMQYTVPQIKDEFIRFQMKEDFYFYIKAKMAGAQDLENVDNWMGEVKI